MGLTLKDVRRTVTSSGRGEGERLWFLGTLAIIKVPGEASDGRFALIEFSLPPPHVAPVARSSAG
jgi:hypothetical protein